MIVRGLVVAAALLIAVSPPAWGQEQEEAEKRLEYRPVLVFNQHLYYGGFSRPRAATFDRAHDELWVADSGLIGIFRPDGAEVYAFPLQRSAGGATSMAISPKGDLAIVDGDHKHILRFNYRGAPKGELALTGVEQPVIGAIAYDGNGNLYVGENHSGQLLVYKPDDALKTQFGSRGADEGQFQSIAGITVTSDGTIYVIDQQAIAVQVFDSQGNFVRGWGKHEMGAANFSLPSGIAVDSDGHVFVSDELRHQVGIFSASGEFIGQFGGLGDGLGQLSFPSDVAVDDDDRVYVVERFNARVQVFARGQ